MIENKQAEKNLRLEVHHIGIAVKDLGRSLLFYRDILGLNVKSRESNAEYGIDIVSLDGKGVRVELICPVSTESPVAKFIEKRGEGLHHIAFRVKDISGALELLNKEGVSLIDKTPRCGAEGTLVAFIHPKSCGGVLIELVQEKGSVSTC